MTYGREASCAPQRVALDGAAVSHPAELVRGKCANGTGRYCQEEIWRLGRGMGRA
jgi:hypothetical protein